MSEESKTDSAESIARCFHETYEALAPSFGYETREASAKPWADVPAQNKGLMKSVVRTLIMNGVISPGGSHPGAARERLENLAARLELSAASTAPSRKSDIEQRCAGTIREILRDAPA